MTASLLAFDTTGPYCAAALLRGGKIVAAVAEPMAHGQAERLFGILMPLLRDAGMALSDLAAIGVGTGPGNFTGIRIGVSAARGLALALDVPAIGVTAFEAAALDAPRPCWAVVTAPRGTVFAQRMDCGAPAHLDAPAVAALDAPVLRLDALEPVAIARRVALIAASRMERPQPRPAPLYVRDADAAPRASSARA